jgi:hypothetical protein
MAISMSDLRKHLLNCAQAEDDHENSETAMGDEHQAMQKASGTVADSHHGRMRDLHFAKARTHKESAENFRAAAEKCTKAAGDDDLAKVASTSDLLKRLEHLENTIVPLRVSAVTPTAPGVTAVPRAGMRSFGEKPTVAVQFEKLVAIEGD